MWQAFKEWRRRQKLGRFAAMSRDKVFSEIFSGNKWHGRESVSGKGSDFEQTRHIIGAVPDLMREIGATRLLDVPCGDFNWMGKANLDGLTYTGGDIVPELIEANQSKSRENVCFRVLDLVSDSLPEADVLMTRDCMVHLSLDLCREVVRNVRRSPITWFLATSYPDEATNRDIVTGDWRRINLEKPPFNFPAPERTIHEGFFKEGHPNAAKMMGLWRVANLPEPD